MYTKNSWSHHLTKPKSGQVSTNNGIITQNIFNVSVLTSVELRKNTNRV